MATSIFTKGFTFIGKHNWKGLLIRDNLVQEGNFETVHIQSFTEGRFICSSLTKRQIKDKHISIKVVKMDKQNL